MSVQEPFFYRMANVADIPACHAIDVERWGEEFAASEAMLRSRIERCPIGNFVAIDRETGALAGSVWTVAMHEKEVTTWAETSNDGMYDPKCDLHADTMFGVNMSVQKAYTGRDVGRLLATRVNEMARALGKRKVILGTRIPEYHEWERAFSAEDYIQLFQAPDRTIFFRNPRTGAMHAGPPRDVLARAPERIDPSSWPELSTPYVDPLDLKALDGELAFFLSIVACGNPCRAYRLLPGYFPDPESRDHGVLVGWENSDHPSFGRVTF